MSSKKIILCFVLALLGLTCLVAAASSAFQRTEDYYVLLDADKLVPITPRGGMSYAYTLPARNAEGKPKEITFSTSRPLRDGAWLRLDYNPMRGVVSWEEIPESSIPSLALEKLTTVDNPAGAGALPLHPARGGAAPSGLPRQEGRSALLDLPSGGSIHFASGAQRARRIEYAWGTVTNSRADGADNQLAGR